MAPLRFCGVYFLVRSRKIMYVGKSTYMPSRVQAHRQTKERYDKCFAVRVHPHVVADVELALIRFLRPPWNTHDFPKPDEPVWMTKATEKILRALAIATKRDVWKLPGLIQVDSSRDGYPEKWSGIPKRAVPKTGLAESYAEASRRAAAYVRTMKRVEKERAADEELQARLKGHLTQVSRAV